mmetsp:Transcript_24917/g.53089  ORF Transcript_24917/g.53089 Transcript_24917/m.53089 type:complete len:524 (-) Transcript_24917:118-1689(-)
MSRRGRFATWLGNVRASLGEISTRAKEAEEWSVYAGEETPLDRRENDVVRVRAAPDVAAVRDGAFARCAKLEEVDLSSGVVAIGEGAFEGCKSLGRVILPSATASISIGANAFYECGRLKEVDLSNVMAVGDGAFRFCASLERVIISSSAETAIGANAFHGCAKLKEVDIANVATIREKAFAWCSSLERITLSSAYCEIGADSFGFCTGLKEVDLSNAAVINIGEGAFRYCTLLERVRTPSIAATATGNPSPCAIRKRAFDGCIRLKEFDLSNVSSIGEEAFFRCTSLEHAHISSSVSVIRANAFRGCTKLERVDICEGLQVIGKSAFHDCVSLERLVVPSTVTAIGSEAFAGCAKLKEVTVCEGLLEIKESTFQNCASLRCIDIPSPVFIIHAGAVGCSWLRDTTNMPTRHHNYYHGGQMIISKWLKSMTSIVLTELENRINGILHRPERTREENLDQIRRLFTYYDLVVATTILELAIWKAKIVENSDKDKGDRQNCRRNCGADMNIIVKGVLKFFNYSNM